MLRNRVREHEGGGDDDEVEKMKRILNAESEFSVPRKSQGMGKSNKQL
jgi:hypothetical protein